MSPELDPLKSVRLDGRYEEGLRFERRPNYHLSAVGTPCGDAESLERAPIRAHNPDR